jgi:DNA polymerase epsilon subunit 1
MDAVDAYAEVVNAEAAMRVQVEEGGEGVAWGAELDSIGTKSTKDKNPREGIIDIREYDVPYYLRVAMDNGAWMIVYLVKQLTTVYRYPSWAVVWSHVYRRYSVVHTDNGPSEACRACGDGIRY